MSILSDERKRESDKRKLELLKRACGSGGFISYHKGTGKVAICGTFKDMAQSPYSFCMAFDKDSFLSHKEYIADMKLLMVASNITRDFFIDNEKKDVKSSAYDIGLSDDMVVTGNPDTMQYISDVRQDITSDIWRRSYIADVEEKIDNAIQATKDASMRGISDELKEYTNKYGYLLNPENLEQERA